MTMLSLRSLRQPQANIPQPTPEDLARFARQLAQDLEQDVPLSHALRYLSHLTVDPQLRHVAADLAHDIEHGVPAKQAFAHERYVLPCGLLFGKFIRSQGTTADLAQDLRALAERYDKQAAHRQGLRQARQRSLRLFGISLLTVAVSAFCAFSFALTR